MDLIKVFEGVVRSSLIGSVIVLMILITKGAFKSKLNPIFHYYLWTILLIKLMIPFAPQTPLNISNVCEKFYVKSEVNSNIQSSQLDSLSQVQNTEASDSAPLETLKNSNENMIINNMNVNLKNKYNIKKSFCFMWIFVGAILVCRLFVGYKKLGKIVETSIKDINIRHKEVLEECIRIMKIRTQVQIVYSSKISSPSLCGLINPNILIPVSVADNVCDEEFKYIVMHELSHLKSKDILINWIITLLSVIYWFNPILLYGFYKMRQDCELACDSNVISYLDKGKNIQYGNAIIRVLELNGNSNRIIGTTSMILNSSEIKRRIIMISKYKKINIRSILLGASIIAIVGVVGGGLNISKASSDKNVNKSIVNNKSNGTISSTKRELPSNTTKSVVPFSSDIVIYNSHADESYPSGIKVTDVGAAINDKLVKEGLKSRFIKCKPPVEYIKSYEVTRDIITKNVKNYSNTVLLDIHRDVAENSNSNTKKIVIIMARKSPYYESNKKFAKLLLKEIEKSSSNEIKTDIFEYNKGNLYWNQDLSKQSLLIEIGNNKSSDSDVEKCTNALVSALQTVTKASSN